MDTLSKERERLQMQLDIAKMQQELAATQRTSGTDIVEAGQIFADRREYLFDTPGWFGEGMDAHSHHYSTHDDRARGKNYPIFENEQELNQIRGIARFIADNLESALCVRNNLLNYTIGTGYRYVIKPKRTAKNQPGKELIAVVQKIVDDFHRDCKWWFKEREIFDRTRRDGEVLCYVKPGYNGRPKLKLISPEHLTEPIEPRDLDDYLGALKLDWSFGVASDPYDTEEVVGYFIDWDGRGNNWDVLSPEEVSHIKLNVDSEVKRGLSDFYGAYQTLERAAKVLRNTAEGVAIQSAIAYIKEFTESPPSADAGATDNVDGYIRRTNASTGRSDSVRSRKFRPGTVLTVAGAKYHPGPMGEGRDQAFLMVDKALLRYGGTRWLMPDYMITGDAGGANFSSSLISESPFVKGRESNQIDYAYYYEDIHWQMLRVAESMGLLPNRVTVAELQDIIELKVDPPRISVRNRKDETEVNAMLHDKGLLSKPTWAVREDLDYESEVELGAEEHQSMSEFPKDRGGQPGMPGEQKSTGKKPQEPHTQQESQVDHLVDLMTKAVSQTFLED